MGARRTGDIDRVLAAVERAVEAAAKETALETAEAIARRASAAAPVLTGQLSASYKAGPARAGPHQHGAKAFSNSDHAGYVEFGTSEQRAQPHLRPAAAEGAAEIPARFRRNVEKRLARERLRKG